MIGARTTLAIALFASRSASATTVLYLNSCEPDGCAIIPGATDSRVDRSDLVRSVRQLGPWRYGPAPWSQVVDCVRSVMSRFDVDVTDVDPGTADHLEIMIGGTPQQFGQAAGVGGLADVRCTTVGSCTAFEPDALVFVFADVWAGNVVQTCASAAQQIAHTWSLDHVLDAGDPMAIVHTTGIPEFRDGQVCGGDCVAGFSQFGLACTGTGPSATHTCLATGAATQDEVQMILAVLGASTTPAPAIAFLSPLGGAAPPAFPIAVDCTALDGTAIVEVDLAIDGQAIASLTAPPFTISAPADLSIAAHTITATCTTGLETASISATVSVGDACASDADCTLAGDVCDVVACIPGSDDAGGLGTPCKTSADCRSNFCASEGGARTFCAIACVPNTDEPTCPDGFACFAAANGTGSCWSVETRGCDAAGGSANALIVIGLFGWRRLRNMTTRRR